VRRALALVAAGLAAVGLGAAAVRRLGRAAVVRFLILALCLVLSGCAHTSIGVGAGIQPGNLPIRFAVSFAVHPDGSIALGGSVGLVTEVGVFSVEANVETNVQPGADETLLIIRHHVKRGVVDSVYRISSGEVTVNINGHTKVGISRSRVFIDALKGKVERIVVKNGPRAPATSSSRTCRPIITSVSAFAASQTQTVTIRGSCLGSSDPYSDTDSAYLRISDLSASWNACWTRDPGTDYVTCSVTSWTPTSVTFSGLNGSYGQYNWSVSDGDQVEVQVWNPQSGKGPAVCTVVAGGQGNTSCGT
jgi:hypothetical protein